MIDQACGTAGQQQRAKRPIHHFVATCESVSRILPTFFADDEIPIAIQSGFIVQLQLQRP
jgi:hypothetical protein